MIQYDTMPYAVPELLFSKKCLLFKNYFPDVCAQGRLFYKFYIWGGLLDMNPLSRILLYTENILKRFLI